MSLRKNQDHDTQGDISRGSWAEVLIFVLIAFGVYLIAALFGFSWTGQSGRRAGEHLRMFWGGAILVPMLFWIYLCLAWFVRYRVPRLLGQIFGTVQLYLSFAFLFGLLRHIGWEVSWTIFEPGEVGNALGGFFVLNLGILGALIAAAASFLFAACLFKESVFHAVVKFLHRDNRQVQTHADRYVHHESEARRSSQAYPSSNSRDYTRDHAYEREREHESTRVFSRQPQVSQQAHHAQQNQHTQQTQQASYVRQQSSVRNSGYPTTTRVFPRIPQAQSPSPSHVPAAGIIVRRTIPFDPLSPEKNVKRPVPPTPPVAPRRSSGTSATTTATTSMASDARPSHSAPSATPTVRSISTSTPRSISRSSVASKPQVPASDSTSVSVPESKIKSPVVDVKAELKPEPKPETKPKLDLKLDDDLSPLPEDGGILGPEIVSSHRNLMGTLNHLLSTIEARREWIEHVNKTEHVNNFQSISDTVITPTAKNSTPDPEHITVKIDKAVQPEKNSPIISVVPALPVMSDRANKAHSSEQPDTQDELIPVPIVEAPQHKTSAPEPATVPVSTPVPPKESVKKIKSLEGVFPPPLDLFGQPSSDEGSQEALAVAEEQGKVIVATLANFGVNASVAHIVTGPSVIQFQLELAPGTKVNKVSGLSSELTMALAVISVRVEAPIPGLPYIGIEIPNSKRRSVPLRDALATQEFQESTAVLPMPMGMRVDSKFLVCGLEDMPHVLVAGTTGSGKSVFVNACILGMCSRRTPEELKLILVDPKHVEFAIYEGLPHLLSLPISEPSRAVDALNWAVQEMESRMENFARVRARNLASFNEKALTKERYPHIVVVVDELADLMYTAGKDVETLIVRLAQKARAAGIHLILATQRPSVDVITGLIKANIPARVAFAVPSQTDSRTILDGSGADKLLGRGDMLFTSTLYPHSVRLQSPFITEDSTLDFVDYMKEAFGEPNYVDFPDTSLANFSIFSANNGKNGDKEGANVLFDSKLDEALELVMLSGVTTSSDFQRYLSIPYPKASRIIVSLEQLGILGPQVSTKPREVLMGREAALDALERARADRSSERPNQNPP